MSDFVVTKRRMIQARWEAVVSRIDGEAIVETPKFPVLLDGKQVLGVSYKSGDDGAWEMSVPVPAEAVADGIRTIVILDGETQECLAYTERGEIVCFQTLPELTRPQIISATVSLEALTKEGVS